MAGRFLMDEARLNNFMRKCERLQPQATISLHFFCHARRKYAESWVYMLVKFKGLLANSL